MRKGATKTKSAKKAAAQTKRAAKSAKPAAKPKAAKPSKAKRGAQAGAKTVAKRGQTKKANTKRAKPAAKAQRARTGKTKRGATAGSVRVEFRDEEGRTEQLAVTHAGGETFRLEAAPSFAYSVSTGDMVRAERGRAGVLRCVEILEKSGNRTLRILFARLALESEAAQSIVRSIEAMNCRCESLQPTLLCVTVPPEASLAEVVEYVKTLGLWWEHADPTYEELRGS